MGRYSDTLVEDRAAALEALPDLSTSGEKERRQASRTNGEDIDSMCMSLRRRCTSKASPLSLGGTEMEPDQKARSRKKTGKNRRFGG